MSRQTERRKVTNVNATADLVKNIVNQPYIIMQNHIYSPCFYCIFWKCR